MLKYPDYDKRVLLALRHMNRDSKHPGVSIVTCTNKLAMIDNVFKNYSQQIYTTKELIIVINNDAIDIGKWEEVARFYENVSIYRLPQTVSLGECYNFTLDKCTHDFIATFDDDDYYGPCYLTDLMLAFEYTSADIVGKRTVYTYFTGPKMLGIRNPGEQYTFVTSFVGGARRIVNRTVFEQARFRDKSTGEDVDFCGDAIRKGFKIFSADIYNFVYIRTPNLINHTWRISDSALLSACSDVHPVSDYTKLVTV